MINETTLKSPNFVAVEMRDREGPGEESELDPLFLLSP